MITGLAHVCFTVRDLEQSLSFYRDRLGLRSAFDFVNDKGERFGVYLHVGGRSFIELFQGEAGQATDAQSDRHLCLEVDDIEATVATLRERGIEVSSPQMGSDHAWQSWLADPDGNRIELHCYMPQSKQAAWLR